MGYCADYFQYHRRKTHAVLVGDIPLGGNHPIRIQSMTNTSTMDTDASVAQCKSIMDAGADYVRLTAQGVREAENLANIRKALTEDGYTNPLVADIHFNPKAADMAALYVEKVRINPGNYVDPVKTFRHFEYSEEEYAAELEKIRARFVPFLRLCREQGTAIRIGVNHGSLSDRIMSRYGDTPAGMVESCLEFLRIAVEEHFSDVVISIKASNVLVMVQTVRLLVQRMHAEGMDFPLHLGVTEAGDGEDGRVKSAVGIGALLMDGIGDTIRVSLSEDPELEIPVAQKLVQLLHQRTGASTYKPGTPSVPWRTTFSAEPFPEFDPFSFKRRITKQAGPFGNNQPPMVILDVEYQDCDFSKAALKPDFVYVGKNLFERSDGVSQICDASVYTGAPDQYPMFETFDRKQLEASHAPIKFLKMGLEEFSTPLLQHFNTIPNLVLVLEAENANKVAEFRAAYHFLLNEKVEMPVVLALQSSCKGKEEEQLACAIDFGSVLIDGFGDGLMLGGGKENGGGASAEKVSLLYGILQSTRLRISRTEYISCPSCGRTLFNLQQVIAQIKSRTSHLKGLKIGIMGCIVNGPGEMADADYGYVGAGRGCVSLYKGKVCVEKNIPAEQALDKLTDLIKMNGDWVDPE